MTVESTNCCGVGELYDLDGRGPEENIRDMQRILRREVSLWVSLKAVYLFHDAVWYGNGRKLAAYIRKHKLGELVETGKVRNPNSRRLIQAWLWTIDKKAILNHKIK
jgi:hypothetical protein